MRTSTEPTTRQPYAYGRGACVSCIGHLHTKVDGWVINHADATDTRLQNLDVRRVHAHCTTTYLIYSIDGVYSLAKKRRQVGVRHHARVSSSLPQKLILVHFEYLRLF